MGLLVIVNYCIEVELQDLTDSTAVERTEIRTIRFPQHFLAGKRDPFIVCRYLRTRKEAKC
jgi:hypothetical protein